jgi:Ca-activated chloride channel family protein
MNMQYPDRLELWQWLLPLAILHLGLWLQQWAWQRKQFSPQLLKRFGPALSLPRLVLKWLLWSAAAICLVYALAVPLGPATKVASDDSGADIILVVDVSGSMHAQDVKPDRLGALKQVLLGFLDRLNGDRVGLVAFAGEAIIACPLTSDTETMSLFLEKLDTDSVPADGTGLGPALKMALDGFEPDPKRGRLIILGTDGEDTEDSDVLAQAKRAGLAGIPVFTLGIGTAEGALIPGQRDLFGNVYAKTYHGQPVRVHLDSAGLKKIAALSGGQYFEGASSAGPAAAYERLRQLKQGLAKGQEQYTREPLYQKPLLWAFWLLVFESLISARSMGWIKLGQRIMRVLDVGAKAPKTGASLLLLLLLCLPVAGKAAWDEGRSDFNQGNRDYRAGDFSGAADAYQKSLDDGKDSPDSHYNIGNAKFQSGDYEGAVSAYQDALSLDPKDADAQHNLDLARRKLEESQKPDKKKGKKDGKGDKKGQGNGPGKQNGQGDGQSSGPGSQAGGGKPQPGKGQPQPSQRAAAAAKSLNQDQVQAIMNQLHLDQQRYAGAFNPMKKFDQSKPQQDDPMDELLKQMGAPPRVKPNAGGPGVERKDW